MSHVFHKRAQPLEVIVVFEPTRFAQDVVHTAYGPRQK